VENSVKTDHLLPYRDLARRNLECPGVLCINHDCDILKIGDDSYYHKNGADPPSDPGQYCTLTPGQIWTLIDRRTAALVLSRHPRSLGTQWPRCVVAGSAGSVRPHQPPAPRTLARERGHVHGQERGQMDVAEHHPHRLASPHRAHPYPGATGREGQEGHESGSDSSPWRHSQRAIPQAIQRTGTGHGAASEGAGVYAAADRG
jgi:hypothetical protein